MLLATLALTLLIQSPAPPDSLADMVELPAALGQFPKLRPPPQDLPMPQTVVGGTLLPSPLDAYVAAQLTVYWRLPELGQAAIDASLKAADEDCLLRVSTATRGVECPGCFWSSARWALIGWLGVIVIGGVAAVWATTR